MFTRRKTLHLAASAVAMPFVSTIGWAQSYPSRPVRWIVSFPAGGSNDVVARFVGQLLSERFGQQFIIENKAGAGGNIGMQTALSSTPDGYTLAYAAMNYAINASLYETLPFNFVRDSVPVAGIMVFPNVMEVHPSVPANSVAEFIAYAKANPGKVSFASAGVGTSQHLSGELFKVATGVDMVHVPYRGNAPALTDMIAGQVQVMFDNLPASIEHVRSGKLRALAVTTLKRSEMLPEVPTVAETLPGFDVSVWNTMVAPKGTPQNIVNTLNRAVDDLLQNARAKARFAELGGTPMPMNPTELGKLFVAEEEKWRKVIRAANIKPE